MGPSDWEVVKGSSRGKVLPHKLEFSMVAIKKSKQLGHSTVLHTYQMGKED